MNEICDHPFLTMVHGTLCAAKETHPALIENVSAQESEAIRRSFFEECVKASRIHHPNVVQMLGIYYPTPQAKLPWLVMEMMQASLKEFLEKHVQEKVPLHFKLSMLVDVSQGLEFLHGQDIIHRDLSTNNVLLTKNLVAKIADLGVAKIIQDNKMKTHTQAPGTTHFMPPEALLNKPRYGKPVDVFSLACVALQVMSHQWPEPKDRVSEDTMTVLTELQRRDEYISFCTLPALKELVELCLHNKSEQRPEISVVCVKLKELKITVEKQVPFATDSNFELFDAVRQRQVQNQKLSATNKKLMESLQEIDWEMREQIQEKDKQIQEKDKQIQEKDKQIQEKDKQLREKDKQIQLNDQEIKEKDQEIKKLQMVNPSTQLLPDIKENIPLGKPIDISALLSPDFGEDYQLTDLGYRYPPEAKFHIQPRAALPDYPPVPGSYEPLPPTTVAASYNKGAQESRQSQHQQVGARALGNRFLNDDTLLEPASDTTKTNGLHSLPSVSVSLSTDHFGSPSHLVPMATGTATSSKQLTNADNSPNIPPIESTPEVSKTQAPDSKYGKTNLNALKNRLQHQKEVTQLLAPARGPSAQSQPSSKYINAFQLAPDKPGAGKTDLPSLRCRLEKSKEKKKTLTAACNVNKNADDYYCDTSEVSKYATENRIINNPHDKKPVPSPQTVVPMNLASKDTDSGLLASSPKISYELWQCANCQTVNKAHHISCVCCKLPLGRMADRSYFCEFCQMLMYLPPKKDFIDTCCPRCKQVYESVF